MEWFADEAKRPLVYACLIIDGQSEHVSRVNLIAIIHVQNCQRSGFPTKGQHTSAVLPKPSVLCGLPPGGGTQGRLPRRLQNARRVQRTSCDQVIGEWDDGC